MEDTERANQHEKTTPGAARRDDKNRGAAQPRVSERSRIVRRTSDVTQHREPAAVKALGVSDRQIDEGRRERAESTKLQKAVLPASAVQNGIERRRKRIAPLRGKDTAPPGPHKLLHKRGGGFMMKVQR